MDIFKTKDEVIELHQMNNKALRAIIAGKNEQIEIIQELYQTQKDTARLREQLKSTLSTENIAVENTPRKPEVDPNTASLPGHDACRHEPRNAVKPSISLLDEPSGEASDLLPLTPSTNSPQRHYPSTNEPNSLEATAPVPLGTEETVAPEKKPGIPPQAQQAEHATASTTPPTHGSAPH